MIFAKQLQAQYNPSLASCGSLFDDRTADCFERYIRHTLSPEIDYTYSNTNPAEGVLALTVDTDDFTNQTDAAHWTMRRATVHLQLGDFVNRKRDLSAGFRNPFYTGAAALSGRVTVVGYATVELYKPTNRFAGQPTSIEVYTTLNSVSETFALPTPETTATPVPTVPRSPANLRAVRYGAYNDAHNDGGRYSDGCVVLDWAHRSPEVSGAQFQYYEVLRRAPANQNGTVLIPRYFTRKTHYLDCYASRYTEQPNALNGTKYVWRIVAVYKVDGVKVRSKQSNYVNMTNWSGSFSPSQAAADFPRNIAEISAHDPTN